MFPTLIEDCKTVNISDLKRWGFLKPNQIRSSGIKWSRGERKTGSISIYVNTNSEIPYIELDYLCNQQPIRYQVNLVSIPSNLGKGVVWYFKCPKTNKLCRKLYLTDTYFYHRSTIKGLYEKQTYSHKTRNLYKYFDLIFPKDENNNHLRTHYAGKPTKRFMKAMKKDYKTWVAAKRFLNEKPF